MAAPLAALALVLAAAQSPGPPRAVAELGRAEFRAQARIGALDATADGSRVIAGTDDGLVTAWDASGKRIAWQKPHAGDAILSLEVSPDGKRVLLGTRIGRLAMCSAEDGIAILWEQVDHGVACMLGERRIALAQPGGALLLLEPPDAAPVRSFPPAASDLSALVASPSGRHFAGIASNRHRRAGRSGTEDQPASWLYLWSAEGAGALLRTESRGAVEITCAAFAGEERLLVGAADGSVELLAIGEPGAAVLSAAGSAPALALAVDPSGLRYAVARGAGEGGGVWIEPLPGSGAAAARLDEPGSLLAWRGAKLYAARGAGVHAWVEGGAPGEADLTGAAVPTGAWREEPAGAGHGGPIAAVALSSDGRIAASAAEDGSLCLWEVDGARSLAQAHLPLVLLSLDLAADGSRAVAGSREGAIALWEARAGERPRILAEQSAPVTGAAFLAGGARVATAGGDRRLRLWDAASGAQLAEIDGIAGPRLLVAATPDGLRLAAAGSEIRILDAEGTELRRIAPLPAAAVSLALSADGTRVAAGLANRTVGVWDAASGTLVRMLAPHAADPTALVFADGGARLFVAGGAAPEARLWDLANGESQEFPIADLGGGLRAGASAGARRIALGGSAGRLRVCELGR